MAVLTPLTASIATTNVPSQLWILDAAVYAAAIVAWLVVLYISYRTVGYVQDEFLGADDSQSETFSRDGVVDRE